MNTEGKVPKKASLNRTCAKSASWRRVESIGTHTVCANFLLTAHSVYGCFLNAVTMLTFHCLRLMDVTALDSTNYKYYNTTIQ